MRAKKRKRVVRYHSANFSYDLLTGPSASLLIGFRDTTSSRVVFYESPTIRTAPPSCNTLTLLFFSLSLLFGLLSLSRHVVVRLTTSRIIFFTKRKKKKTTTRKKEEEERNVSSNFLLFSQVTSWQNTTRSGNVSSFDSYVSRMNKHAGHMGDRPC